MKLFKKHHLLTSCYVHMYMKCYVSLNIPIKKNLAFAGDSNNIKLSPLQVLSGTSDSSSFDEYFPFHPVTYD